MLLHGVASSYPPNLKKNEMKIVLFYIQVFNSYVIIYETSDIFSLLLETLGFPFNNILTINTHHLHWFLVVTIWRSSHQNTFGCLMKKLRIQLLLKLPYSIYYQSKLHKIQYLVFALH